MKIELNIEAPNPSELDKDSILNNAIKGAMEAVEIDADITAKII